MTYKSITILCIVVAIVAAGSTRYKTVETTRDVVHNDVQTIVKTIKLPTGEVDTTTTTTDHSVKVDTDNKTAVQLQVAKNWLVSGVYSISIHTLEPSYGLQVNRRILGPIFIGANANTKGEIGLSLGMEF